MLAAVCRHSTSWTADFLTPLCSPVQGENEAKNYAGSLPKALQLLTAALEKTLGVASTGVQSRVESI